VRELYAALAFLVEHAPAELELALLARNEPALPLAHLRGRGELLEVTAESGASTRRRLPDC
jgi:ATP/maltotriose-dependent transcriptional regulator MalT